MQKQIAHKSSPGSGAVVMDLPPAENNFRVDRVTVKIAVTVKNKNAAGQTMSAETFCHGSKINWRFRDGKEWLVELPWRAVEWWNQLMVKGFADALVECVDRSITAVDSATEVQDFYLDIPLALPMSVKPLDYAQALALLGQLTITPGADLGHSDLSVTNIEVWVAAHGSRVSYFAAGSRVKVQSPSSQVPRTEDSYALSGDKMLSLQVYTSDKANSPIASTKPTVAIDGGPDVLRFKDLDTLDVNRMHGQLHYGSYTARSSITQTRIGTLVAPGDQFDIGDLPEGDTLQVSYASNPGTAGDHHLLVASLYRKDASVRRQYPGADRLTPEQLDDFIIQPKADVTGLVHQGIADFLPEQVRTPEAVSRG